MGGDAWPPSKMSEKPPKKNYPELCPDPTNGNISKEILPFPVLQTLTLWLFFLISISVLKRTKREAAARFDTALSVHWNLISCVRITSNHSTHLPQIRRQEAWLVDSSLTAPTFSQHSTTQWIFFIYVLRGERFREVLFEIMPCCSRMFENRNRKRDFQSTTSISGSRSVSHDNSQPCWFGGRRFLLKYISRWIRLDLID